MARNTETIDVVANMSVKGAPAMRAAADDISKLEGAGKRASSGLGGMKVGLLATAGAIGAAGLAAKQLYGALREGATLVTTQQRFEKLSESIGTTADTMLGQLRSATKGMISDMDLMASASQIVSLKLADNSDQVVRLATVAGTLGWDMQQVILTFANLSTMRLDALGLSVDEVTSKQKELEKQGYSTAAAFKEAVILAGEARLEIGGVSETEQAFKQLETAIANTRSELSLMLVELASSTGFVSFLGNTAKNIELNRQLEESYQKGKITVQQYENALIMAAEAPGQAAAALEYLDGVLNNNITMLYNSEGAWRGWAIGISVNAAEAAAAVTTAGTQMIRDLVAVGGALDWMGGAGGPGYIPSPSMENKSGLITWMKQANAMYRENDLARSREVGSLQRSEVAYRGVGAAMSEAEIAANALAAAHARMADAFSAEINFKVKEGEEDTSLISEAGLVNVEAMNKALYEQSKAAGLTAGQMAILGVMTGQFTQEQAAAALKAAILTEKIRQVAAQMVATGSLDFGGALAGLDIFRQQLDTGQITGAASSIEGLAGAANSFAGEYAAELSVDDRAAMQAIDETYGALMTLVNGTYVVTIQTTTTGGVAVAGSEPVVIPHEALGGPVRGGKPYLVGEVGPEVFVPGMAGQVVSNSQLRDMLSGQSGGSSYNISITNYIDGKQAGRGGVDDVTTDKIMSALNGLGMGRR